MRAAAPPGQARLDEAALVALRAATRSLHAARPAAARELARFLAIADRNLCLPTDPLARWLDGAHLLVTGGSGCIGAALLDELAKYRPARVVSVSRGVTPVRPRPGGTEYLHADIRDRKALERLVARVRPDVIFHLAAQRDPSLAEVDVHRTVTTNILGTRNVLAAAAAAEVKQVVCASTGKALRPYSPDVYAACKRAAEWVASQASAERDLVVTAARFTHVVDNSLIHRRLERWAADGAVVRLHGPDAAFYAESAAESAQLLLLAGLGGWRGQYLVHAITDLGWPVSLLDLALGVLARAGSGAPIYFTGYERGYEEVPFPGLYDPATAGDVSPLLNALEAARASMAGLPIDAVPLQVPPDPAARPGPGRPGGSLRPDQGARRDPGPAGRDVLVPAAGDARRAAARGPGPGGGPGRSAPRPARHGPGADPGRDLGRGRSRAGLSPPASPTRGAGAHCASVSGPGRHGWSAPTFTPLGPTGAAGPADSAGPPRTARPPGTAGSARRSRPPGWPPAQERVSEHGGRPQDAVPVPVLDRVRQAHGQRHAATRHVQQHERHHVLRYVGLVSTSSSRKIGATRPAWIENQENPRRTVQNHTRGPADPQRSGSCRAKTWNPARAHRVRCSTNSPGLRGTSS